MIRQQYSVRLKNSNNEKWVRVSARSETEARYEAERQNSSWKAIDIRRG